jgi:membrane protein DedA with SNARE-associated domain
MSIPSLVASYGYLAVFAGAMVEGETFLLLGGFAAHQGYLSFPLVALAGMGGGLLGDQIYYRLGRRFGPRLPQRFPRLAPGIEKMGRLLRRHANIIVLSLRFLYGLRTVGPMAVGMSGIPPLRFLLLDGAGAVLWATATTAAGYLFGQTLEWLMADLKRHELAIMAGAALAGALLWLLRHRGTR